MHRWLLPWLAAALCSVSVAANDRPNVILLLADDLGYTGLGCYGSDLHETPNLDGLARSGTRFMNAYAACTVCSPTRASIMTGKYPARLKLTDFIAGQNRPYAKLQIPDWNKRLELSEVTIAEALAAKGYATAHIGKWHLAPRNAENGEFGPRAQGFEVSVLKPAARGYFLQPRVLEQGAAKSRYLTDHLTDEALKTIDAFKDRPFFMYFAYHTPHTPIQGKPELVEAYRKKIRPGMRHKNPEYAAMVSSLDESVGRILKKLDQTGLTQNTVVIFLSDNGGLSQRNGKLTGFVDNHPLRRGKGSAYEGGTRVPMIVRYPGMTKPGSVSEGLVSSIDLYPTILELTGVSGDGDHNRHVDGLSMRPFLSDASAKREHRALFWHYPHYHAGGDSPYSAVRMGDWKLIEFYEDRRIEMYNLRADVGETTDWSEKEPDQAALFLSVLRKWRDDLAAQEPSPNPNFDPEKATQVSRGK